jgi:Flp pilus assembly protein CpaB
MGVAVNMLQNKKLIQLLISAVMAAVFVQFYLKAKEENIDMAYNLVDVIVASRDIAPNKALTEDSITTRKVADRFVEPGAFREKIPGEARKRVLGKVVLSALPAGAQILQTNLISPSSSRTGLEPKIPRGKRAFTLRLGNLDVAKLILPGNRIDILATFNVRIKGSDATSKMTYTILQNILVLAVDKDIIDANKGTSGKDEVSEGRILSLALDPLEAQKLTNAQIESGQEISVVVRADGDDDVTPMAPTSASNLLDRPAPSPAPPARAK